MGVIETASEMIRFDTSGPPAKELPLAKWIHDYLDDLGATTEIQIVDNSRANVIGKIGEGKSPGLLLSGHIDVVLAGEPSFWRVTTPFEPKVRDGKLYGRGACDMKGPDACILEAFKELSKENYKRQLTVAFTAGEDTGGWFVNKIIEEKKITNEDSRFGIIPEPSMMDIVRTHKGSGGAKLLFHGKAAHSSRPELGVNAIMKASDFLQELKELQKNLNKRTHPLLGPTTIECTIAEGGFKANIIPDQCALTLSSRLIPGHEKVSTTEIWLKEIAKKCEEKDPEFKMDITNVSAGEPLNIPENSEVVQLMKDLLKREPIGVPYYTEAVSYTKSGIPTIICGPGSIDQAHTPDEYITLKQLEIGVKTFKETIKRVCL